MENGFLIYLSMVIDVMISLVPYKVTVSVVLRDALS